MTFAQLKTAVKDHCNLTSTEADTRVGKSINRHYRRITSSLGLDVSRFVTRSATTTNGVQTVTFTEIEKIDRILDTTDATAIRLLQEVSIHTQRSTQPGDGEPTTWAFQNSDADSVVVRLDTVPQTSYSLQADGTTTLSDLTSSDEPVFPESYHDILSWFVIAEELLKKEKPQLAAIYEQKAESLLSDLRFYLNDSATRVTRQGGSSISTLTGGGSAGGAGNTGSTSYTQSGLLTFDRGAGLAPFAVAQATAAVVTNLDADKLDGQHGSYYLDRANHTGTLASTALTMSSTDRLVGRDTVSGGASEEISVGGGIEFTGAGALQTSAFTGDVTKSAGGTALTIPNDTVTYAKMQNVSATSRILGRKTAAAGDTEECTLSEVLDFVGSAAQGDILYRGAATWARLGAGTSGYVLQTTGAASNPQWAFMPSTPVYVLDRDVTVNDVNTSTSETTVYTYTVPANTFGSTKQVRLSLIGDYLNNSGGNSTLTVKVKLGATTIASAAHTMSPSANRAAQSVQTIISACNATNAQRAVTEWCSSEGSENNNAGTLTIDSGTNRAYRGAHNGIAEDGTGTLALAVTVQHSVNSANVSFRCHAVVVEYLG